MLADTPWAFPLWFGWAVLSLIVPVLFIAAVVLSSLRATRMLGFKMLLLGIVGAVIGCIGDFGLAMMARESLTESTAMGWCFAAAGGFSLFAIFAGVLTYASLRTSGLTNR